MVSPANAHDWYSKQYDPVTHGWCCNTTSADGYGDCAVLNVEPGVLDSAPDGIHIRLTAEQAQRINPLRTAPVDTIIPESRLQPSPDGNWHLCLPAYPAPARGDIYCIFAPNNS